MDVRELNQDQLLELKFNLWFAEDGDDWFYDHLSQEDKMIINLQDSPGDIPDEIVFRAYAGISFVEEDFSVRE